MTPIIDKTFSVLQIGAMRYKSRFVSLAVIYLAEIILAVYLSLTSCSFTPELTQNISELVGQAEKILTTLSSPNIPRV